MTLVWDRFPGSGSDLLCMLALADYANDAGERIYPAVTTIARRLRLSHRQTQRVLAVLVANGWIKVAEERPGMPKLYNMDVGRLRQVPLFDPSTIDDRGDIHVRGDAGVRGVTGDARGCRPRQGGVSSTTGGGDIAMSCNPPIPTIEPPENRTASGDAVAPIITKRKRKLTGWKLIAFLRFWECFDFKHGRADAADAWLDMKEIDDDLVEQICRAAMIEARDRPAIIARGSTPKWAQGWLTSRRWEDEHYQPKQKAAQSAAIPVDEKAAKRRHLEHFNALLASRGKPTIPIPEELSA